MITYLTLLVHNVALKLRPRFATHLNFLDPQKTEDGKPYAPIRYKQIIKECYLISRNLNTSYTDVLKISPTERELLISFLMEEAKRNKENIERIKAERKNNK